MQIGNKACFNIQLRINFMGINIITIANFNIVN